MSAVSEAAKARRSTYMAWYAMVDRCTNPRHKCFKDYGGRGIGVCQEWRSFDRFIADMGLRRKGLQLDRIDNDAGYCKANCRWATPQVNANNRRNSRLITYLGKTLSISQWSREVGLSAATINRRLGRGMPIELALTLAPIPRTASKNAGSANPMHRQNVWRRECQRKQA